MLVFTQQEQCQSRCLSTMPLALPSCSSPRGDKRTAVLSGILSAFQAEAGESYAGQGQAHLSGFIRTVNAFPDTLPPHLRTHPEVSPAGTRSRGRTS